MLTSDVSTRVSEEAFDMDTADVARLYKCSKEAVIGWRKRGIGPPFAKLAGGLVRYNRRAAIEWAESQLVQRQA